MSYIAQAFTFCLGLATFYTAWSKPRGTSLFLAGGVLCAVAVMDLVSQRYERRKRK